MITEFKSGHWYRYIGPGREYTIAWNSQGKMDFLLDGKPHQCNKGMLHMVSFFDSSDPDYRWSFKGSLKYFEEVEMNEEMEQIQKLRKELSRLEEIVKAKEEKKIDFDSSKLYIGICEQDGQPYILAGRNQNYCFYNLERVCGIWSFPKTSGQEAIDCAVSNGIKLKVYEFSDRLEGMKFFMDKYCKYWGNIR